MSNLVKITPNLLEKYKEKWLGYNNGNVDESAWNREVYYLQKAINGNEMLQQADQASVIEALMNARQFGLSLNPALKMAYVIPRRVKGTVIAQLEPSYMGLSKMMMDLGIVKKWSAECVYEGDEFDMDLSAERKITKHKPHYMLGKEQGKLVLVYSTATLHDGSIDQVVVPATDIYSIRDRSESFKRGGGGPWGTDFGEMAKKTAFRRHFKTLPKSAGIIMSTEMEPISKYVEQAEEDYSTPRIEHNPRVRVPGEKMAEFCAAITSGGATAEQIIETHNLVDDQGAELLKLALDLAKQ
jgi:recombination protein RecT